MKPFSGAKLFAAFENLRKRMQSRKILHREIETANANLAALAIELALSKRQLLDALKCAREASLAKDEFIATVNHELRTPLTNIHGWAQLLRTGKLDSANYSRAFDTIGRNAQAQIRLIDDLLDISRVRAGSFRLDIHQVELPPIISAAHDALRDAARAKDINIEMHLHTDACPVLGDSERLQQVIWNLLSNAVKFTPRGGQIEIRLTRVSAHAAITIRDTGKGISADFLPHVFEKFSQVDSSSTRAHGGLGLGLAMVSELVQLHGGTVHAESSGEGNGSVFTVKLPLVTANLVTPEKRAAAPPAILRPTETRLA